MIDQINKFIPLLQKQLVNYRLSDDASKYGLHSSIERYASAYMTFTEEWDTYHILKGFEKEETRWQDYLPVFFNPKDWEAIEYTILLSKL